MKKKYRRNPDEKHGFWYYCGHANFDILTKDGMVYLNEGCIRVALNKALKRRIRAQNDPNVNYCDDQGKDGYARP